ncbi:transposase, partial [Corynebacterium belfantii]|nr:transposase [Corynebacterium belfantii]
MITSVVVTCQTSTPTSKEQITTIFHDSNATFGYRRIWRALRNNNTIVNKKVVRRLMRE